MQLAQWQSDIKDLITDAQTNHFVESLPLLTIYQQHYLQHLSRAINEIYPCVQKILGEACFASIAETYIHTYPSRSPNLQSYGEYFGAFLLTHEATQHLAYLEEVAKFEWLCHKISFAGDPEPFNIALLAQLTPEDYHRTGLVLHPASALCYCYFPVLDIIELCETPRENPINLDASHEAQYLLLRREDNNIRILKLTKSEFKFFECLQENNSLEDALKTALHEDADFDLEKKLPTWIKSSVITDIIMLD